MPASAPPATITSAALQISSAASPMAFADAGGGDDTRHRPERVVFDRGDTAAMLGMTLGMPVAPGRLRWRSVSISSMNDCIPGSRRRRHTARAAAGSSPRTRPRLGESLPHGDEEELGVAVESAQLLVSKYSVGS